MTGSPSRPAPGIHSMTGYGLVDGMVAGTKMRLELKTLNHRFLEVKLRLPRELSAAEQPLRSLIQSRFSRGVFEVKLERAPEAGATTGAAGHAAGTPPLQLNLALASHYYDSLIAIQKKFGLTETLRATEIAQFPEVLSRGAAETPVENAWAELEPLARAGIDRLTQMRAHEGQALRGKLDETLTELDQAIDRLRARREELLAVGRNRIRERLTAAFAGFNLVSPEGTALAVQSLLESRIAQELAILIDRSDVEEELVRFKGHLDHFRQTLNEGGPVGRKLDFILQELNREINTLGNKSQDLSISEETVPMKVRIEQLREQVMNLE